MSEFEQRNIALLIDSDNASPSGIDPVLTVLAELGQVNIRRAYGNWRKTSLKGWIDLMHRYGIEPQQQFDMTKGKNATDMKMTIDAQTKEYRYVLAILHQHQSIQDLLRISSDTCSHLFYL